MKKFAICKWSGGSGITVEVGDDQAEREAREVAKEWIGEEPVKVFEVTPYEPPSRVRSSVPPTSTAAQVAKHAAAAREHTRRAFETLGRKDRELVEGNEGLVLRRRNER